MLTGRSVFVYRNAEGFSDPAPGIVTFGYEGPDKLVDVEVFYRKSSQNSHAVPLERVRLVDNAKEAREIFAKGHKYVAHPYNPADPELLDDTPAAEPAKAPAAAAPKASKK